MVVLPSVNVAVATLLILFTSTWAQQLSGAQMYMGYPGLSTACVAALNTNTTCPLFLSPLSNKNAILDTDQVTALCVDSCYTSLQSARKTIKAACTASTDVIVYNTISYPATFIVDNFLFTYNVSCHKDSSTGKFCDPQILTWSNQTWLTAAQNCSDCWLGTQAILLGNPLGYDPNLASNLASLTSSCSANKYSFSTPTAYALNSTATTLPASVTATKPPTCTSSYVVQATDDCNAVALALGVSTYNLLYQNNLDLYCQNFAAAAGSSLCIPGQCKLYTWQALDSCNSVASNFSVTVPQFLSWNPNFNSLCQNSLNYVGYQVCVSPPGGFLNYAGSNTQTITNGATAAAAVPTNAQVGSNRKCGKWYIVQSGDTCGQVSTEFYLSLSDFYFLNPEVYSNCTNLDLGIAYCVEPVGSISTYSGYTVSGSATITYPPASFSSVNTAIPSASSNPGYTATTSLLPKASGTIGGCLTYRNYDSSNGLNDCSYVAYAYDVTTAQILSWNPSLPTNLTLCALKSGYSYCVLQSAQPASYCLDMNATMSGTASNCNCFTEVHGYQNSSGYDCEDIVSTNSVTMAQLLAWNTWMGTDCDKALYANLAYADQRAICIGVNASISTSTTSKTTSSSTKTSSSSSSVKTSTSSSIKTTTSSSTKTTTSSSSKTSSSSSMGPTASGVVKGCLQYYTVKSGDSCSAIESTYGITFAQFYSWNPSIGSDCTTLVIGDSYCVKGPASTTTTTSTSSKTTSAGPTDPTQTGVASNCNKWYNVVSGDSCSSIETKYSITFAQLYQWNPAIGSDCASLWVGYAVCVGVSS